MKKYQNGGKSSLGMKSVKAGFDKNPGVTRADIIVAAKKQAKGGANLKKQAATAIAMKAAGKKPKKARGGATLSPSGSNVSRRLSSYPKTIGKAQFGMGITRGAMRKAARKAVKAVRSPKPPRGKFKMESGGKMKSCRGGCY